MLPKRLSVSFVLRWEETSTAIDNLKKSSTTCEIGSPQWTGVMEREGKGWNDKKKIDVNVRGGSRNSEPADGSEWFKMQRGEAWRREEFDSRKWWREQVFEKAMLDREATAWKTNLSYFNRCRLSADTWVSDSLRSFVVWNYFRFFSKLSWCVVFSNCFRRQYCTRGRKPCNHSSPQIGPNGSEDN